MSPAVPRWKKLIITLLLMVILLNAGASRPKEPVSKPLAKTSFAIAAQSDKPSISYGSEGIIKIKVLLFVLSLMLILHVSGKIIRRKLLFTAEERNCFYVNVTIHAP